MQLESIRAHAYRIPTSQEEADGTLRWKSTGLLIIEVLGGGGQRGVGYSYTSPVAAAAVVNEKFSDCLIGRDLHDISAIWWQMLKEVRNIGQSGLCATAISAVDTALWDLKCRVLGVSLSQLIGRVRDSVDIYGSGGFTNWSLDDIKVQLDHWSKLGCKRVKMKVGEEPDKDVERVRNVRELLEDSSELFVDANGAYTEKQALALACQFAEHGVTWFEEPVSSENLKGLALLKSRMPPSIELSSGEYIYTQAEALELVPVVDVLQLDATRCLGVTGFLKASAIAEAWQRPISTHTAPLLHSHLAVCARGVKNLELFWDHERIESKLWSGLLPVTDGRLSPPAGEGLGATFDFERAEEFRL